MKAPMAIKAAPLLPSQRMRSPGSSTTVDAFKESTAPGILTIVPEPPVDLIATWTTAMQAEGLAARTWTAWPSIVRRAAAATGQHPTALTGPALTGYLAGHSNPNTRATYYRGLSAWCAWLVRAGHRPDDPMADVRPPRVPRGEPHPISTTALERLLSTRLHRKTRMMILLGAYAGLRVHEIAKVRAEDVDLDEGTLRVVGKGGVDAVLPLHPLIAKAAAGMPGRGWWFPSIDGRRRPVLASSVSLTISGAMTRAGVRGTAHSLRHWHATALLEAGADAVTVQKSMRHRSLATTQIYVRITDDRLREAIGRLPTPAAPGSDPQGPDPALRDLPVEDAAAMLAELRELRALLTVLRRSEAS